MKKKYSIWQNIDIDVEDWKDGYIEEMEMKKIEIDEDNIKDEDAYSWAIEKNDDYLDDERDNLRVVVPNGILVIADLGLWDGRHMGYKEITSGKISDCLFDYDCDYCDWYCDNYDFRFDGSHHDGRNHYIYRTWADGTSEQQKENYLEKLYHGKATHKDMLKYTRSIRPYIADIYGWKGKKIKGERCKTW